jgi:hypothetical protein
MPADASKEGFFFEKKNQKTFAPNTAHDSCE